MQMLVTTVVSLKINEFMNGTEPDKAVLLSTREAGTKHARPTA